VARSPCSFPLAWPQRQRFRARSAPQPTQPPPGTTPHPASRGSAPRPRTGVPGACARRPRGDPSRHVLGAARLGARLCGAMGRRGVGHRHGRPRRRLQRQRGRPAQHKVPPTRPSAAPPARAARRSCRMWRAHRLIWVESPANPTWGVTDIPAMADLAQEAGALLAVDSTAATPALSQPLTLGADLVMHSATKCSVPACATPRRRAPRARPVCPQQAERHPATAAATAATTAAVTPL
jgi:hypothetical protein